MSFDFLPFQFQSTQDLIIAVSVFGLVFTLWLICFFIWYLRRSVRTHKIEERLGLLDPEMGQEKILRLWHDRGESTVAVPGSQRRPSLLERLDQLRRDAGWELPAPMILLSLLGTVVVAGVFLFTLTQSLLPGVGTAAGILMLFWLYLRRSINRREALFERQFVDALELAARSLRAGHPLVGALQLISEEVTPPVSTVFREICQQQSLGVSLEEALQSVASKSSSDDFKLFATAVIIQLRTGGNLADMMDRLAAVIRERLRLNRRVRVLTAQTQFSKRVLLALPFVIFVVLNAINPDYMLPLYTTPMGRLLLGCAALGLLCGAWTMNRLAVLRY
jgi:tight adherence protein B